MPTKANNGLLSFSQEGRCGNHDQFVNLARKLAYFNGYKAQKSTDLYETSGTTVDTYYGNHGVAALTYELGTKFFQECSSFETKILPDNLNSLLYAAKAARTPFKTVSGHFVWYVSSTKYINDYLTPLLTSFLSHTGLMP